MLEKYLIKSSNYSYILSNEGIYKLENDNIFKLKINDLQYESRKINNVELLFDYSYNSKKDTYHVPFHCDELMDISVKIYSLREKSNLKLHIEKKNNKIHDVYFLANDKSDEYNLKEDINTFLTMLN
tara:strand:+ start:138 stop:518 length:381 start_codon:yes stop_codon:yes gene_type:complete